MSSVLLRLCLLTFVCAGLTAAAPWLTCPNSAATRLYSTAACAPYTTCVSNYCTCAGATNTSTTAGQMCVWGTSRPNCTKAASCATTFIDCVDDASAQAACVNVTTLSSLKMSLLNLAGGGFYNGSVVEQACHWQTCQVFNMSVTDTACTTIPYATVCSSPFLFLGTLTLSGNWTAILADPVKKAAIIVSLTADLTAKLGVTVVIISLRSGSLIVEFSANVAAGNAALQANLASAAADTTWLASTQAAYTANGGQGQLGVTGIGATTTAPPTTTAVPGATTATPGATPTPGTGGSASTTSVLVAIAVAMLAVFAL